MVLLGTLVNGVCIIIGTLLGKILHRIPEDMKGTVMKAIGLAVIVLGLQMGLKSENFLIVIISLALGAAWGEWMNLEDKLNALGNWLETKIGQQKRNVHISRVCNRHPDFCHWCNGRDWCVG